MVNLKEFVGLDIRFDDCNYGLIFDKDPAAVEPAARTISQMQEVLTDEIIDRPQELYFMYRDIFCQKDRALLKKYKLRFDITIIKPDRLGREFMKTQGHYHPKMYPELYEVVFGEAICLQQRPDKNDFTKIKEVIAVKARQGQKILCLPGCGHILINPSDKPLITSNWVSSEFSSEYELYKKARGAAYYALQGKKGVIWQKNNFYNELPEITFLVPNDDIKEFGLKTGTPMYSLVNGSLEKIDFLNNPEKYKYDNAFRKQ